MRTGIGTTRALLALQTSWLRLGPLTAGLPHRRTPRRRGDDAMAVAMAVAPWARRRLCERPKLA